MKPARVIVTRSPHRMVGMVCCPWLQDEPIHHESITERWFICLAVMLPRLGRIQHQPFEMSLPDGCGKDRRSEGTYTPDFLLQFDTGEQIVVEVKPEVFVDKHRRKLQNAASQLRQRKLLFHVVTDEQMEKLAALGEATLLRRQGKSHHRADDIARVVNLLEDFGRGIEAASLCERAAVSFELVTWLVARGEAYAERPFGFTVKSIVFPMSVTEVNHANVYVERWFGTSAW